MSLSALLIADLSIFPSSLIDPRLLHCRKLLVRHILPSPPLLSSLTLPRFSSTWDDYYRLETEDSSFQDVIDSQSESHPRSVSCADGLDGPPSSLPLLISLLQPSSTPPSLPSSAPSSLGASSTTRPTVSFPVLFLSLLVGEIDALFFSSPFFSRALAEASPPGALSLLQS